MSWLKGHFIARHLEMMPETCTMGYMTIHDSLCMRLFPEFGNSIGAFNYHYIGLAR